MTPSDFLMRMCSMWRRPWGMGDKQEEIALAEYERNLSSLKYIDLDATWDNLFDQYTGKEWPKWPDIKKAYVGKPVKQEQGPIISEKDVMNSPGGQYCLREGFAHDFLLTAEREREIPTLDEAEKLVIRWRKARAELNEILEGGGFIVGTVAKFVESAKEHEKRLQAKYRLMEAG